MPDQPDDTRPSAGKDIRETSVAQVMTSTGIHKHPTAFLNTGLPVLQIALNVELMTANLGPLLEPLASSGGPPAVTYARLLAYKQGNRGLIRYELTGTAPDRVVFGKLYPDTNQAVRVYETMRALWADVFADDPRLHVPRPLGCVPELSMLVYVPAEGRSLDEAVAGEQALQFMDLAGEWLGRLHRGRLPLDRRLHIATELVNVQAWATLIGQKYPEHAEAAAHIARQLKERANKLQLEAEVPIHKDFHYGHILVDGGLTVIDFDEMRLGDPNFDLAHFCANLHLLAYRKNNSPFQFSALQGVFLSAYARQTGWQPNERFVLFYAYTCLKIAKQLCTLRGLRPRPEGEDQRRQVQLMIEQGLAALPPDAAKQLSSRFATLIMESPTAEKLATLPPDRAKQLSSKFATLIMELPRDEG